MHMKAWKSLFGTLKKTVSEQSITLENWKEQQGSMQEGEKEGREKRRHGPERRKGRTVLLCSNSTLFQGALFCLCLFPL